MSKYYVIVSRKQIGGEELERFATRELAEQALCSKTWISTSMHVEEREADELEGAGKPIGGHFGTKPGKERGK